MIARSLLLTLTAAALTVSGCSTKESVSSEKKADSGDQITVTATDTACTASLTEGKTGPTNFSVINNGTKVTEFYVYGKDNSVLDEVENISPGLKRELTVDFKEPGTYRLACKPGMAGDGIRTDFTVKAAP